MKKGFALFENRCYYFARNIWNDSSNIYDRQANTYSDTKRICKTVFGPNVVGKMIEPKSLGIMELIKEYVYKNFPQHIIYPDARFPIPQTMWIGNTVKIVDLSSLSNMKGARYGLLIQYTYQVNMIRPENHFHVKCSI